MARSERKRAPSPTPAPARRGRQARLAIPALAGLAAAAVAGWLLWPSSRRADGPVVIISIDTLRADRLPAYGYRGTRTPHFDRVVSEGALFERAYSHSPQTLPAHTSIFSGQLPFEHGVRDNIGFTLAEGQRTLQGLFKAQGYATAAFVSSYVLRRQTGFAQGFDHYDDDLPAATPDLPLGQVQRPGADTVNAAIRWIDRQGSPRFLLFVHIYEPHAPYQPPPEFAGKDPYDGEVEHADAIAGSLLEHLRRRDLYDGAVIVLLSDHGEGLGDHGEDEHGIFLYRETIHIPLVIRTPGAPNPRRVAAPVQQIDLAPTLLDYAGIDLPAMRGRTLRAVLGGTGSLPETGIYSESLSPRYHFGWSELYALTDERYRLIRAPRRELYDLARDPAERHSIATERQQVSDAMAAALDALIDGREIDAPSAVTPEDRQKLAALGYIGTATGALETDADSLPDPKDRVQTLRTYKRATELASAGRYADAIGLLRSILEQDPQMTDVWVQLAGLYERAGRTDDAIDAYKGGIRSNPRSPASLAGAASALLRAGRLDEARAHAELATAVAPAAAYEVLARVALERGEIERAREAARSAEQADPSLPMLAFIEGLFHHRHGRYEQAVAHLMQAQRASTRRTVQIPEVHYYLADSLARLERYAEAEPLFAAELRLFPGNIRAYAGQAMLYRSLGRAEASDEAVDRLVRSVPTAEAFDMAAQLWTMFGEPGRAAAARAEAARRRVQTR